MKLYCFLFEQSESNPYFTYPIRTAEEFAREESSEDEFLAEKYLKVGTYLSEVSKANVRKFPGVLPKEAQPFDPDIRGRRIPIEDLKTFIGHVATGETTREEDKTTPAMHAITAQNLLIPTTRLARKKAERSEAFRKGIEEQGLEVASEAAVKNLIAKLTDYSKLKVLSQNAKMEKSGGEKSMYYNFTLPALRGLIYDEKASTPEDPVFLEVKIGRAHV